MPVSRECSTGASKSRRSSLTSKGDQRGVGGMGAALRGGGHHDQAWARMVTLTQRCQEVQRRAGCWSRPVLTRSGGSLISMRTQEHQRSLSLDPPTDWRRVCVETEESAF